MHQPQRRLRHRVVGRKFKGGEHHVVDVLVVARVVAERVDQLEVALGEEDEVLWVAIDLRGGSRRRRGYDVDSS